jgi:uncharacterized protein (TIGR02453 family)
MKTPKTFHQQMSAFFTELAANQNKDWFHAQKTRYESEIVDPLRELVDELNEALKKAKIDVSADPAKALFRINRDVRFPTIKAPTKRMSPPCSRTGASKGRTG